MHGTSNPAGFRHAAIDNLALPVPDAAHSSFFQDSLLMTAISNEELYRLEGLFEPPPPTFVSFPSPSPASPRRRTKLSAPPHQVSPHRTSEMGKRKVHKSNSLPEMPHSSHFSPDAGLWDSWAQRYEAATVPSYPPHMTASQPLSPPASTKLSHCDEHAMFGLPSAPGGPAFHDYSAGISPRPSFSISDATSQIQSPPLLSPMIPVQHHRSSSDSVAFASGHLHHTQPIQQIPAWPQNSLESLDFGYSAPSSFNTSPAQQWWGPSTPLSHSYASSSDLMTSKGEEHSDIASLTQASFSTGTEDLATQGLLIQCDPSSDASGDFLGQGMSMGATYYVTTSPPPAPVVVASSGSRTPQTQQRSPRTPALSPSAPARVRKNPRQPKRKQNAPTPTPPMPSTGFVNFTPSDSRKILTGVAPSGSSKTKARRAKEAEARRRHLSEAAIRAVEQAGGNLELLQNFVECLDE